MSTAQPGDLYILNITADGPITVTGTIGNSDTREIVVRDLKLVAVRRSDGSYSFRDIKATLGKGD